VLAHIVAHPDGGASRRRHAREAVARGEPDDEAAAQALRSGRAGQLLDELATTGWRFVSATDPRFPALLAALADPPLGLFVRGELPERPAVAIVGARRCSAYGREVSEYLGRELAAGGACVVSGMARGVDSAAHRGALAGGGPTVAVWGAGPDRVYPPEHAPLAEEIAASGALVTEYPPGSPPLAAHFPERNRLIAGLARLVVVVEADERSGALVTARLALDEGRDVMAVPGSVFSRLSAGPNALLRAGAAPVLAASDVLAILSLAAPRRSEAEPEFLHHVPSGDSSTVDELAARSGLPVARLLELLLELELGGWLARDPDGRYRRSHARSCRSDAPPEGQV
jgi:DNA processing protein